MTRVEERDAARVVVVAGNEIAARRLLDPIVVSVVHATLEPLTLPDVRRRRTEIEALISDKLKPKCQEFGLTLVTFTFREFIEL